MISVGIPRIYDPARVMFNSKYVSLALAEPAEEFGYIEEVVNILKDLVIIENQPD